MEYKLLGKSNLNVSRISFGCMSLEKDQKRTTSLIHKAIDLGINFFDTADLYQKGLNEEMLGNALKTKRAQVMIASKVGNQWRPDGSGWDWNPSKSYIKKSIHQSLKRLQTDYVDLYQLHGGTIEDPIDETIEAFEELKAEGLIRYYGISSIRPNVIREYVSKSNLVSVMMQYSLLDRRPEETCLQLLYDNQIGVIVRGAVAKGLLLGKTPKPYLNHTTEEVMHAREAVMDLSGTHRSPAQTAIGFCWAHPAVTTVATGIRNEGQLLDNAATCESEALTGEQLQVLRKKVKPAFYEKHL